MAINDRRPHRARGLDRLLTACRRLLTAFCSSIKKRPGSSYSRVVLDRRPAPAAIARRKLKLGRLRPLSTPPYNTSSPTEGVDRERRRSRSERRGRAGRVITRSSSLSSSVSSCLSGGGGRGRSERGHLRVCVVGSSSSSSSSSPSSSPSSSSASPSSGSIFEVCQLYTIPLGQLSNPFLLHLLHVTALEYGYSHSGVLRVACDADVFEAALSSSSLQLAHDHEHLYRTLS